MNPTSPEELRTLAKEPHHQEWEGRVRAAMSHAAQLLEAADLAVKAEVERADAARRELLARQVKLSDEAAREIAERSYDADESGVEFVRRVEAAHGLTNLDSIVELRSAGQKADDAAEAGS